ncbi:hypothetical protein CSKR_201790 [Clonorchis sinensis]|uniref:Uncharacterized protein n=1 Tax=Clonorchis sinensis TaxID=79923 RepID=A0A8T1MXK4_CLOSI|nr:hypothetical protein CSKR_201790 [Clonorchis sinensis]
MQTVYRGRAETTSICLKLVIKLREKVTSHAINIQGQVDPSNSTRHLAKAPMKPRCSHWFRIIPIWDNQSINQSTTSEISSDLIWGKSCVSKTFKPKLTDGAYYELALSLSSCYHDQFRSIKCPD